MRYARIVYNRHSRNAPPVHRLEAAIRAAGDAWRIDIYTTDAPGHATQLAREAADAGAEAVFACGGDGTVNEVVNGLAGSGCALGVLRGGMGDVFAREAGLSKKPEEALTAQLNGERRRFDLGMADERRFLLMCGIGLDAEVVQAVPDKWKRRLGSSSYALWGAGRLLRYRARQTRLVIDGEARDAGLYWLLLGNTRSYGNVARITGGALVDDGRLDAYIFEGRSPAWIASTAARLALRRHHGARGVSFYRVNELAVETPGLAVQIDGEYIGRTPMRFSVDPQALDVLLPSGHCLELFGRLD